MKLYVANLTQSKKMVYLSGIRYIKKDGKYTAIPSTVSLKIDEFKNKVHSIKFPFVLNIEFKKGVGAYIVNE